MAAPATKRRPARTPAAVDLDAALAGVAAMTIDELRGLWRERRGEEPPPAFSKDLIARALAYWLQEECLGGLKPRLRKLLAASSCRRRAASPASEGRFGHRPGASGRAA